MQIDTNTYMYIASKKHLYVCISAAWAQKPSQTKNNMSKQPLQMERLANTALTLPYCSRTLPVSQSPRKLSAVFTARAAKECMSKVSRIQHWEEAVNGFPQHLIAHCLRYEQQRNKITVALLFLDRQYEFMACIAPHDMNQLRLQIFAVQPV